MCGIVGYIGKRSAASILFDGLKRLEYRGYDSAGLAVGSANKIQRVRVQGRVDGLTNEMNIKPLLGNYGIAHTRWATHGVPSVANAHPQSDQTEDVFVAHNGIFENYQSLKNDLIAEGYKFTSETDTEVIAHLIKKFLKQGLGLEMSVKQSLRLIKGAYAILVVAQSEPNKIIAAKYSSPLRLGVGEDEFIIASDASAIVNHTKQVVSLSDGEMVVVTPDNYIISEINSGVVLGREPEPLLWDTTESDKGEYEHYMLKEIFEQPEAIKNTLRGRLLVDEGRAILGGLRLVEERLRTIKKIHIVACGTAYHAGLVGEYMLEEYAGLACEVCVASEFRYRKAVLDPANEAVLILSQSGETADSLAAIREAKEKGVLTLGIVNVVGSSIASETEAGVYNHVGPETAVASTKAFVSQLVVLALLTLFLGRKRTMSLVMGKRIAEELRLLPFKLEKILSQSAEISKLAEQLFKFNNFYYLGRKYNFPIALEGALKLKEISYCHAEATPAGELKHGALAIIDNNFPVVYLIPQDSVYEKNLSNLAELKARNARVVAIATEGDTQVAGLVDSVIYIPKTLEMLTPILSVAPLQLLAYFIALKLGRDVDKPRNLAKSVTVE